MNRIKIIWERLRTGLTLLAICVATLMPLTGAALLGLRLDWNRWAIGFFGLAVLLVEAYLVGAYLREEEFPPVPPQDDDDERCGPPSTCGAGRRP